MWPRAAFAQQSDRIKLLGILMGFCGERSGRSIYGRGVPKHTLEVGWTEGRNVRIELRWAGPDPDRTTLLAKELAFLRPDAILDQTTPVVRTLAREMQTTPIVFVTVSIRSAGFAATFARPGGNITGFTVDDPSLGGKWVELLKQMAPGTARVALLFNPTGPTLQFLLPSIQAAASSLNVQVNAVTVHAEREIEGVIAGQTRDRGGGLIVLPNAFNITNVN